MLLKDHRQPNPTPTLGCCHPPPPGKCAIMHLGAGWVDLKGCTSLARLDLTLWWLAQVGVLWGAQQWERVVREWFAGEFLCRGGWNKEGLSCGGGSGMVEVIK